MNTGDSLGLSKCGSTSARDLPRSSRISACNALRTSRKSRGFGTLSVIDSTIALPESLMTAIGLATMKMPSAAPPMITNS